MKIIKTKASLFLLPLLLTSCLEKEDKNSISSTGLHENKEVRIRLFPNSKESIKPTRAYMGERTNPEDIGFVMEKRIDITNPEILESPEAVALLKKSEGYCIIGDFVLTYKASKDPEYNDIVDANILSIKEGTNPNWRKIESYKKEGYHENEAVTFKISKHPKGYGMQFMSLSKGTRWPRQGSISVVNPEIVPVPDFEGDLAFFDFIISYSLKNRSETDKPIRSYSAKITEARFLRPTLKDKDEE